MDTENTKSYAHTFSAINTEKMQVVQFFKQVEHRQKQLKAKKQKYQTTRFRQIMKSDKNKKLLSEYAKERSYRQTKEDELTVQITDLNATKSCLDPPSMQPPKASVLEVLQNMRKDTPSPETIR